MSMDNSDRLLAHLSQRQCVLLWAERPNLHCISGAPVGKWLKRWPTDLAVPSSSPTQGEIFSTINRVPLHTPFHYHPPIVMIGLKYC